MARLITFDDMSQQVPYDGERIDLNFGRNLFKLEFGGRYYGCHNHVNSKLIRDVCETYGFDPVAFCAEFSPTAAPFIGADLCWPESEYEPDVHNLLRALLAVIETDGVRPVYTNGRVMKALPISPLEAAAKRYKEIICG